MHKNKNEITGDIIQTKHSNVYADNFDKIFRKDTELTEEELAYQAGFEAGRSFERGCDD